MKRSGCQVCARRYVRISVPPVQYIKRIVYIFLTLSGTGDVWFSLRNTIYRNNSIVMLEDIGESNDTALLCMTGLTACCRPPYTDGNETVFGNWFFPNGSKVSSDLVNETSGNNWDFYSDRGQMVVRMNRRRGGEEGMYRCEIPDAMNIAQTIYIGVYSISTGELP